VERTVSMLTLTAIHDIMKVEALLPIVDAAHAPYKGYRAGELLLDHDIALGYLLEHEGGILPAYASLPVAQQRSIRFTQADIGFNHGWLVQAEAPPGALFSRFKRIVQSSNVDTADIAFYFVHWITDLAGAVATPLNGCEKFTVRFPQSVFSAILKSFSVVQQLAHTSPTQLTQDYLMRAWFESGARRLVPPPTGPETIAVLRLAVQSQGAVSRSEMLEIFSSLPASVRDLLGAEMARSGVASEPYSHSVQRGGPAFLLYYGPQFLRQSIRVEPRAIIALIAEVYRGARQLFPLSLDSEAEGSWVTIRVDQVKGSAPSKIAAAYAEGFCWMLVRKSSHDAIVERWPLASVHTMLATAGFDDVQPLHFWPACCRPYEETAERSFTKSASGEGSALGTAAAGRRKGRDEVAV